MDVVALQQVVDGLLKGALEGELRVRLHPRVNVVSTTKKLSTFISARLYVGRVSETTLKSGFSCCKHMVLTRTIRTSSLGCYTRF